MNETAKLIHLTFAAIQTAERLLSLLDAIICDVTGKRTLK
jgi:hypothetical protein